MMSATPRRSPSILRPIIASRRNPSVSGSVTATICTTPDSTRRCTRWRTAASDSPTAVAELRVREPPVLLELLDDRLVDVVDHDGAIGAGALATPSAGRHAFPPRTPQSLAAVPRGQGNPSLSTGRHLRIPDSERLRLRDPAAGAKSDRGHRRGQRLGELGRVGHEVEARRRRATRGSGGAGRRRRRSGSARRAAGADRRRPRANGAAESRTALIVPSPAGATSTTVSALERTAEAHAVAVGGERRARSTGTFDERDRAGVGAARSRPTRSPIVNAGSPSTSAAIGGAIGTGYQRCAGRRSPAARRSRAPSSSASVLPSSSGA